MANPGGNYPGRQIFIGSLKTGEPAFAYFVSGRSSGSQQRYVSRFLENENAVRIKPTNPDEPFDIFRHYQAVRIDPKTGLLVVSNSQAPVDPLVEAFACEPSQVLSGYMKDLLAAIGPEYDSKTNPTPRIAGAIVPIEDRFAQGIAITARKRSAQETSGMMPLDGVLTWVATYDGNVNYGPFNGFLAVHGGTKYAAAAKTAQELAEEIYDISDYTDPKYGELRVCTVAGVRNGNGPGGWELARRNRREDAVRKLEGE